MGQLPCPAGIRRFVVAEASAALKASLGPHRLLATIDDLDRADHDVLHELLLAVKEIVNVEPCVFICGYDADAVSRTLQRGGIAEPESFLSKIFVSEVICAVSRGRIA